MQEIKALPPTAFTNALNNLKAKLDLDTYRTSPEWKMFVAGYKAGHTHCSKEPEMKANASKQTTKKSKPAVAKCRERMATYSDAKRDQIQDMVNNFFGCPDACGCKLCVRSREIQRIAKKLPKATAKKLIGIYSVMFDEAEDAEMQVFLYRSKAEAAKSSNE